MQEAKSQIEEMMGKGELQGQVQIDKEGLRITLEEQGSVAFFESGRSEITDEMKFKLEKISPILKNLSTKHDIVVEGHTDSIPIRTKSFASNWELSTARATSVVKHLLEIDFAPKRLSAVGYGEYHPSVPNDSPENRQKNRRVVFFVKNNPYPDPPAMTAAQTTGPPVEGEAPAAPAGSEGTTE
jgi:chemotaxis protein MotB